MYKYVFMYMYIHTYHIYMYVCVCKYIHTYMYTIGMHCAGLCLRSVLQCIAVCCILLQRVAVHCILMQRVAVCCTRPANEPDKDACSWNALRVSAWDEEC